MELKTDKEWQDEYKNFLKSEKAVSEIVGNVLILGITVMSVSTILLYSVPMIQDLKEEITFNSVQQAFAIIDMRASKVVLGDSPLQMTDLDIGGGSLTVLPNGTGRESYIDIITENDVFKVNIPMGKLRYTLGDRAVAYEGGGLWNEYDEGSVMISSPQLHYGGKTLTISETNISGDSSHGGKGIVTVTFKKSSKISGDFDSANGKDSVNVLFPVTKKKMNNPISYSTTEKVYMNIKSDYYTSWAEYIGTMVDTDNIIIDHGNRTALVEFNIAANNLGRRTSPISDPIKLRGLPKHKKDILKNFTFRIYSDDRFTNFDWDFRGKVGDKELIFHIFKNELIIGYRLVNGNLDGETWGGYEYPIQQDGIGYYIDVNLLDKNVNLKYKNYNVGSDNAVGCQPFGTKIKGLNEPDYSWADIQINGNDIQSIYNITQHYISEIAQEKGDVILYQCSPGGGHDPEAPSSIIIDYDVTGKLEFLYVADNRADVSIN